LKAFLCSLFWFVSVSFVGAKVELEPLPEWNPEDLKLLKQGKLVPGQALLTKGGLKREGEEKPADPKDVLPERKEVTIVPVPERPEINPLPIPDDRSEVSRRLLDVYFGEDPKVGVNDPQMLLSMQERMDLNYAVQEHEKESPVPIYLFVFDELQMVPEDFKPNVVFERYLDGGEKVSIIVYYYLGAPERTQYYLGGGASAKVPEWQMRELLSKATHAAREKSDLFAQLDDFVGQLSMRLFWVEQIMGDSLNPDFVEVEKKRGVRSDEESVARGILNQLILPKLVQLIILGFGLMGLGVVYFKWRGGKRYRFPEPDLKRRLGASRGAIHGGVLSYKDQHLPPSEQREQFKDPL